jgi:CubicO group peptidase (beta-lactamase class C family)
MWIASCTKLMTAISVMQCVEKGLLDLDADVSTILPEWKDARLLKGFEEGTGKPIIEKAKNKITLKRLLTHSTGLSYVSLDPRLKQWAEHEGLVLTGDSSIVSILLTS